MSDAVLITLITQSAALVGTLIVTLINTRKINEVHKATNSMKDELVAATRSDAFKNGVEHQKGQEFKNK